MIRCRPCQTAFKRHQQSSIMRSTEGRFYHGKYNATLRGYEWTLTMDEYATLIRDDVVCAYCGNELNRTGSGLDRLDDAKPYTIDNVVPSCWPCNYLRMRGGFSYEEMRQLGPTLGPIWKVHPPNGTARQMGRPRLSERS
jgi:hypothetical protein